MNALWIRVEANEKNSRRVWQLRRALGIPAVHALGHLTALGGELAQHCPDGDVSEVDDDLLELWAMWEGEPGAFAAAFRAACAPDGHFERWDETMGELVKRREKDRERKRGPSADIPSVAEPTRSDVPRNSAAVPRNSSVRTRRNETNGTNEKEQPSPRRAPRAAPEVPPPPAGQSSRRRDPPKHPHFPEADCRALHERWEKERGPVEYPAFRKALALLYGPAGPVHPLADLLEAVAAFGEYVATLPDEKKRWETPAQFVQNVHRWVELGRLPYVHPDTLADTERGRLLDRVWKVPAGAATGVPA